MDEYSSTVSGTKSPQLTLAFNWKLSLLGVCMFPVLLNLGFWQLERAQEKLEIMSTIAERQALKPLGNDSVLHADEVLNRRVTLTGRYDPDHYWLLDNKTWQGRVGYHLIMPFYLSDETLVFVNRGWLMAPDLRSKLPSVVTPQGEQTISGFFHQPSRNSMVKNIQEHSDWPKRIQVLEIRSLNGNLQKESALKAVLRLNEISPGALNIHWTSTNSTPEKHRAYAVQWFSMALVLMIALVFSNTNMGLWLRTRSNTD